MNNLNPNSQAIILLTAYFSKDDKPLTVSEYSTFASWLLEKKLQPSDLLSNNFEEIFRGFNDKKITQERIIKLLNRGNAMAVAMQKWSESGVWVITRSDSEYPKLLKERLKFNCPPILYGSGFKNILNVKQGVSIVGSRKAPEADIDFTFELGKKIANCGHTVISGCAKGIDEASMLGALDAEGTVIGIVSDDLIGKSLSKKYRKYITNNNLILISPYYPEAGFDKGNAMGRNKYIYLLSETSIVIHSGKTGGTFEGATENLKKNWVNLFVKENNDSELGNNTLLKNGGRVLPNNILEKEEIDFLFEKQKISEEEESVNNVTSQSAKQGDLFLNT
jgi:predicted Rossmann fold nucleotide-binding protein DprA/Smf involved in DNA uptake